MTSSTGLNDEQLWGNVCYHETRLHKAALNLALHMSADSKHPNPNAADRTLLLIERFDRARDGFQHAWQVFQDS